MMKPIDTYFIGEVIEINLSDLLHQGDHRALTSGKTHLVAVFFATQLQSRDLHAKGLFNFEKSAPNRIFRPIGEIK